MKGTKVRACMGSWRYGGQGALVGVGGRLVLQQQGGVCGVNYTLHQEVGGRRVYAGCTAASQPREAARAGVWRMARNDHDALL